MQSTTLFQFQCSKKSKDDTRLSFQNQEDLICSSNHTNYQMYQNEVRIELIPRQKQINLQSDSVVSVPLLFQLNTQYLSEQQQKVNRAGVDLICVVDNSASMSEESKMKLVRKSLRYILKILNENDRICIITYSKSSKIRTGFMKNTIENKQQLKQIIKNLNTANSTNIHAGLSDAFWMIKNRKTKNNIASIFLLSDGLDDNPQEVRDKIYSEYNQLNDKQFNIYCFGYGNDCDPKLMIDITQLTNGEFYLVKEISNICDYFILATAGLINVLLQEAKINIEWTTENNNYNIKANSEDWKSLHNNLITYQLGYVLAGDQKHIICEIILDNQSNQNIEGSLILKANLSSKNRQNIDFFINTECVIQFTNREKLYLNDSQVSELVEVNYLRNKGAQIIGQACKLADQSKYEQANIILLEFEQQMQQSIYNQNQDLDQIKSDIQKSKLLCQPQVFQQEGFSFMIKKERNHLKRKGSISNLQDCNKNQQEIMQDYKLGKYNLSDDSCPGSEKGSPLKQEKRQNVFLEDMEAEINKDKEINSQNEESEDEGFLNSNLAQKIMKIDKKAL